MPRWVPGVGVAVLAAVLVGASACDEGRPAGAGATSTADSSAPTASPRPLPSGQGGRAPADGGAAAGAGPVLDGGQPAAPKSSACPADMQLVEGEYCPALMHHCLEHHPEYVREQKRLDALRAKGKPVGRSNVAERCLRFEKPSRCVSRRRRPMRFCMDRYEWPNKKGEIPRVLTTWSQARQFCRDVDKRLCTEHEFNFACEGEQLLPYVYGYVRDSSKCSIDRPYVRASTRFMHYDECLRDPSCTEELSAVDQRAPAGAMAGCVSPFGVYDLNGNVDEWVMRVGQEAPSRSGLKGGWWGPLRNRCRPITKFHKESDYGYGIGFRCCRDAAPQRSD